MKEIKVSFKSFSLSYHEVPALQDITFDIRHRRVTSLIGPSASGKSTLLRSVNRMNDVYEGISVSGSVYVDAVDIYNESVNVASLRRNVGMVFQQPNVFPKSVFENLVFGLRIAGEKDKKVLAEKGEAAAMRAGLWDEIKDRLTVPAYTLSVGQQQRLCIARVLAMEPAILLMDEPTSALDPQSTGKIEELIIELRKNVCIVLVTHNLQQAARVSDFTAFFYSGKLIEYNKTLTIVTNPVQKQTEDFITGRFG